MTNFEKAKNIFLLYEQQKTTEEIKDFKLKKFSPEIIEYSFIKGILFTIRYTDNYSRIHYNTITN